MKRIILLLAIVTFGVGLPRTQAAELTVDLFYDQLAPYGDWVDAGEYGYAWHPRDVGQDWRPYADGRWAYTDAGWTWVSEEPYSWAVYHYGRWANLSDVGWIWVPGREWGPAWVSFRRSDHYVGWAPLPPEASFGREVQTISSWSDSYYDVGPTQYTFVEVRNFGAPRLREFIAPERENVRIISETRNITNIRVQNNGVYVGGPEYEVISRESAQPIQRLRLERRTDVVVTDRTAFRSSVQGDSLRMAAPLIQSSSREFAPAKVSRRLEKVEVNRGWRDAGDPAATQKLRTKMQAEAQVPAALPPKPTFQRTGSTAAGGNSRSEQPANTPKGTAETGAPSAPKASGTATENPTSTTRSKSQGVPTDPNSPPAGTAAEKNTPSPTGATAKGKKGQRGAAATPEPTATTNPKDAPTATTAEKGTAPESTPAKGKKGQRGAATTAEPTATTNPKDAPTATTAEKGTAPESTPAKGKKGQRGAEAAPGAQPDSAAATPAASRKKGGRSDTAPGATPSRNAPPESANNPTEKPAITRSRPSEPAADRSNTPPAPEAKPEHRQPNAPPEGNTRSKPETGDRPPLGGDANPKDRGPSKKMESAPEAPKSHQQPNAEPKAPTAKDGAPAGKGQQQKGDKKDAPKDEKKSDEAPK